MIHLFVFLVIHGILRDLLQCQSLILSVFLLSYFFKVQLLLFSFLILILWIEAYLGIFSKIFMAILP